MTDRISVWEQTFRQPLDSEVATELGRLNQAVAQANARTQNVSDTITTLTNTVNTKAPIDSPLFTGTPRAPDTSASVANQQLINTKSHYDWHAYGRFLPTGGAQSIPSGTSPVITIPGNVSLEVGGVLLGAGGSGILCPPGVYIYSYFGILNGLVNGVTHILAALSYNAGAPTNWLHCADQNNYVTGSHFIQYCGSAAFSAATTIRPVIYANNPGTMSFTLQEAHVSRVRPL